MKTIITTVGTSLISNWQRTAPSGAAPNDADLTIALKGDPVAVSAETNSLSRLIEPDDHLVFVCSETDGGRLCAAALQRHYAARGHFCKIVEVAGLSYTASRFKGLGLRALVSVLAQAVRESRRAGREPLINATGGFKAEVAYAVLVGMLFDARVAYIHDAFKDVVIMPPIPVSWDMGLVFDCEEFLEWLNSDLRPIGDVKDRMRGLPSSVRVLVEEDDGHAYLSPMGEALLDAYDLARAGSSGNTVLLSSKASAALAGMDAVTRKGFETILQRLRIKTLWLSKAERKHGSDCMGWPRGHRSERCLFFEDEQGAIRVCEVALHDAYEALLKRGVYLQDYKGWAELPAVEG